MIPFFKDFIVEIQTRVTRINSPNQRSNSGTINNNLTNPSIDSVSPDVTLIGNKVINSGSDAYHIEGNVSVRAQGNEAINPGGKGFNILSVSRKPTSDLVNDTSQKD